MALWEPRCQQLGARRGALGAGVRGSGKDGRAEPGWMEGFLEQGLDVLDLLMDREGALALLGGGVEPVPGARGRPAVAARPVIVE